MSGSELVIADRLLRPPHPLPPDGRWLEWTIFHLPCSLVMVEPAMRREGEHVVETAVEARAGFLDRPVLVVLVVGSLLAAVFLALSFAGVVKF